MDTTPKNPPAATSSPNSQSKKPVIILDRSPDRVNDIRINDFNIATLYGLGRCFIPSSYIYKYRKGNYVIRINKFFINDEGGNFPNGINYMLHEILLLLLDLIYFPEYRDDIYMTDIYHKKKYDTLIDEIIIAFKGNKENKGINEGYSLEIPIPDVYNNEEAIDYLITLTHELRAEPSRCLYGLKFEYTNKDFEIIKFDITRLPDEYMNTNYNSGVAISPFVPLSKRPKRPSRSRSMSTESRKRFKRSRRATLNSKRFTVSPSKFFNSSELHERVKRSGALIPTDDEESSTNGNTTNGNTTNDKSFQSSQSSQSSPISGLSPSSTHSTPSLPSPPSSGGRRSITKKRKMLRK